MIITHSDTIGEHKAWKEHFPNMQRVIHSYDIRGQPNSPQPLPIAKDFEIRLNNSGEWYPDDDLEIIHTPGHTPGSISIRYMSGQEIALFSGDHLAYSNDKQRVDGMKSFNKGSKNAQLSYLYDLATDQYPFQWLLPAHGQMVRFQNMQAKNEAVFVAAQHFADDEEQDMAEFEKGYSP